MASSEDEPAVVTEELSERFSDQEAVIRVLSLIDASLKSMPVKAAVPLSHYRALPDVTQQAYEILQQGAALVHGTSTKYTLLGKLDTEEQTKMALDLQKGCELIATSCLVLHEKSTGSSPSLKRHIIQASRGILATTKQLLEAYTGGDALTIEHTALGAQKTGAVWQTCSAVLDKKLPMGNRNSMRRDLFTYMAECQETMDEFQELVDQGPAVVDGDVEKESVQADEAGEGAQQGWEAFLSGQDQQYTNAKELAIAEVALTLLKISRGTVKLTLQACEVVGEQLQESSSSEEELPRSRRESRLAWLGGLHGLCSSVGEGLTDLGTTLYPPMKEGDVTKQLALQISRIEEVLDKIVDATLTVHDGEGETETLELSQDVTEMALKLKTALTKRTQETHEALAAVGWTLKESA
jgi:hypothetical protein